MSGFWSTVAAGFSSGVVTGGGLKGGVYGAFSAGAFYGVGSANWPQAAPGEGALGTSLTSGALAGKTVVHGLVGGVMASLQGGKFGHGFVSAGITQLSSGAIDRVDPANPGISAARVTAAALVGGTTSVLTGGKFANGATSAVFVYVFGAMADGVSRGQVEAFKPREGDTVTGRYGLFEEYSGDPLYEAVYDLGVRANGMSSRTELEYHAYGGVDEKGNLTFQRLRHGRSGRITTELLTDMAKDFKGTIQYSFHNHGADFGNPGAFENFSPSDLKFYGNNAIVGRVTGFVATPRGLLLMHNPAMGVTTQIGLVPPVKRPLGR